MNNATKFKAIITVCADGVHKLRGCDLDRALNEAEQMGVLKQFAAWLTAHRPDMASQIAEAV